MCSSSSGLTGITLWLCGFGIVCFVRFLVDNDGFLEFFLVLFRLGDDCLDGEGTELSPIFDFVDLILLIIISLFFIESC